MHIEVHLIHHEKSVLEVAQTVLEQGLEQVRTGSQDMLKNTSK